MKNWKNLISRKVGKKTQKWRQSTRRETAQEQEYKNGD